MKAKLHLVLSIAIFFTSFCIYSQQGYWKSIPKESGLKSASLKDMDAAKKLLELDRTSFKSQLASSSTLKGQTKTIYLPDTNGEIVPFQLVETSVLHPDLAKKYPNIKSYTGTSDNGQYRIKLSSSHKGLQSMVVDLKSQKQVFMEPVSNKDNVYVIYENDAGLTDEINFICKTSKDLYGTLNKSSGTTSKTIAPLVNDQLLRKYRIAISATGEYTQELGGTVEDALAGINATITRVNEVFETDLGVTLELIANNDLIVFTDPDLDPYDDSLNAQVQSTITSIIGEANYDVGHLFHKVGQGQDNGNAGFIGAVCVDNSKGSGFSAAFNPQGDVFDLDYVAHEIGHQFGANHTWSFESEGTGVQAEPASGSTIMGYAGIVGANNVASSGDDYFHFYSILQISEYLATTSCAETTALTNSPPVLTPVDDFIIPKGTAFILEGIATDPDVGDVLTYTWEQINDGLVTNTTFGPTNPSGANFRSLPPTTDPVRYFPKLSEVAQGNLTQTDPTIGDAWETVSEVERNLSFAFTVRDNAAGGGQVTSDVLDVNVIKAAGPFTVTSQSEIEVYQGGSVQEITWDVANTNVAPIHAETVDIFLSLDGGLTFPISLLENTPNDGSQEVLLPGDATVNGRFMVKASDNIFFAVNSANFTIEESEIVLNFDALSYEVCQPDDLVIPFVYETYAGFNENATFSATVPTGITVTFSPTNATDNNTAVDFTLSNTIGVAPGVYDVTVTATSASVAKSIDLSLTVQDGTFSDVVLVSPANAEGGVSLDADLTWEANPLYSNYDVEIATDLGFANILESANIPFATYKITGLDAQIEYYWRVRPNNGCGTGTFSAPFSFTTTQVDCKSMEPGDLPLTISSTGTPTVSTSVVFLEDLPISDVNVSLELDHTYLEDLIITLISPQSTEVTLISNTCGSLNNINAVFDDEGDPLTCSDNPAISGIVSPLGSLASLKGESILGEWVLRIEDTAASDGGALIGFSLEICVEGNYRPDEDEDGVFDDGDDLCLGTPKGVEVDTNGCAIYRFATDNFELEIESETCRTRDNGSITITPFDTAITYTAVLNGDTSTALDFTDSLVIGSLNAGEYSVCITGTNGVITYEEVCFTAIITQPDVLDVAALLDASSVNLEMSGASLYNVELNGVVTQTSGSNLTLPLKEGANTLRVYSNIPCQGVVEKTLFYSSKPILSPNPVYTTTEVYLGRFEGLVGIEIFTANGRLVKIENRRVNGNDLELDLSGLSKGIYYMRINKEGLRETFKFIKE
ncbi:Por secretion system C-terminal sorting domain-containing protein [Flagellimonas zhangzhouensis]|uniref:Por secretion system C-terminal sorting domain-containing protein n=2 Tax=Flagellimonas zhangzhouensis TaxID=1073328 RepID=A0A1H2U0V0_9FLAO|nr:Por secretion system C-terminal sorting domain-containing protein [Allomuricauda zhangzhouensis]SDW49816.1 Por secretion system C-terminal sorting domain-containing protein [Allomuricauda zhangzhouensis]